MDDLKKLMQHHFIKYASYVILDRAIPHVIDGLKPVQRRILYILWQLESGRLHKVANVAGQTMALHPHGDAPIVEALVNMANRGYLLDRQGNFGNPLTGDPSAAARYIETKLSALANETLFNPDLTETAPSYDGRHQEPICLPAKIPLLLLQGAEGIAVGMATHIFPHNFVELLEAEKAILEGRPFQLLPDFQTGGIMDASDYDKGKGKIKLRAKIDITDSKTLKIREICYGTTTESLMQSIDEAAKKGKIKIESIHDYTASKVDIEIKLPRGHYAEELLDSLYAYTQCAVSLSSQILVIKDHFPWETDVEEILRFHTQQLQDYLKRELEIERTRLLEKIFSATLERIFIENRLYKEIEELKSTAAIHQTIATSLEPFHPQLSRIPTEEDREGLLSMPIRRISRFDIDKNQAEILAFQQSLSTIEKDLKNIKKVAIRYLDQLLKKYGKAHPRKTQIQAIEEIDRRAMETRTVTVGFDPVSGFIGTKVPQGKTLSCTNYDKLLILFKDGTYQVISIPEKHYLHQGGAQVAYFGIADKKTVLNTIYRDSKTHLVYGKRFIITQFILDKLYRYMEEGMDLHFLSPDPPPTLSLHFIPKTRQRQSSVRVIVQDIAVKNVSAKSVKLSSKPVKKIGFE